jgi:hypothetical protein
MCLYIFYFYGYTNINVHIAKLICLNHTIYDVSWFCTLVKVRKTNRAFSYGVDPSAKKPVMEDFRLV